MPGYDLSKSFRAGEIPGGISAFRAEIIKNLEGYLDFDSYRPRGKFIIFFNVDTTGKISDIDVEPKLPNSGTFYDDLKYAIKKVKRKWNPATVNGMPVPTRFRMPLNFDLED